MFSHGSRGPWAFTARFWIIHPCFDALLSPFSHSEQFIISENDLICIPLIWFPPARWLNKFYAYLVMDVDCSLTLYKTCWAESAYLLFIKSCTFTFSNISLSFQLFFNLELNVFVCCIFFLIQVALWFKREVCVFNYWNSPCDNWHCVTVWRISNKL